MVVLGPESTILVISVAPLTIQDATRFINRLRKSDDTVKEGPSTGVDSLPHLVLPWKIRNKYYTADVHFRIVQSRGSDTTLSEVASGGEEPAIIVLASSQEVPSPSLRNFLESLADRVPEFDVSLLVTLPPQLNGHYSSTASSDLPVPSKLGERVEGSPFEELWDTTAIDRGFEWFHGEEGDSASLGEEGSRNDNGLQHIRDALEVHMWEGMERVPKPETNEGRLIAEDDSNGSRKLNGGLNAEEEEEDQDEEFASLGVPPLPEPRPFIPTKLEFPATFLPSIPRKTTATSPPTHSSSSSSRNIHFDSEPIGDDSFEDDFSPFVEASTSSTSDPFQATFPPLPDTVSMSNRLATQKPGPVRTTNGSGSFNGEGLEEEEEDLESLDNLFEQIRLARQEVIREENEVSVERDGELGEEAMLMRRRERAEKLLEQVLGVGGF